MISIINNNYSGLIKHSFKRSRNFWKFYRKSYLSTIFKVMYLAVYICINFFYQISVGNIYLNMIKLTLSRRITHRIFKLNSYEWNTKEIYLVYFLEIFWISWQSWRNISSLLVIINIDHKYIKCMDISTIIALWSVNLSETEG